MKLDRAHIVPYLGGCSRDGQTVFIDYRFPATYTQKDGFKVNAIRYLKAHEEREFKAMSVGLSFNQSHRIAARFERNMLEKDGVNVEEYYEHIYKWVRTTINSIDKAKISPDLDTSPYSADRLYSVLKKMGYYVRACGVPQEPTDSFLDHEMRKDIES